jgi:hypothetical protein
MAKPIGLVLDCRDPAVLADFWSEALGYVNLGEAGSFVLLLDPDGQSPKLLLQGVPEDKTVKAVTLAPRSPSTQEAADSLGQRLTPV